jgi:LAO/AO transport system ATPase
MLDELVERFRQGDRLALARLLTLVSRGEHLDVIRTATASPNRGPLVAAVTGAGGVGKSSLVGRLIELLRGRGKTVAVLACDPQSSITGGALLGDRVRMPTRPADTGVFVRSLAAGAGHQAVAQHLDLMIDLLATFGFDCVLLETAGAGQGDTAVRALAEVVVVLVQPEAGDALQWEKAGLLEIADVVVVHKADLPGADHVESQLRELLNLPGCRDVAVLRVSSSKGEGLEQLWAAIELVKCRSEVPMFGRDE